MTNNRSVKIEGLDKVLAHIKQIGNPAKLFDADYATAAAMNIGVLKRMTNKLTGNTARSWGTPQKLADSKYVNSNNVKTQDKKHLIVNILSDGRAEVRPVRKKLLYIPLTNKGRSGAGVFGVDFVFAKKARAVKGNKFMDKAQKEASQDLTRRIQARIRAVYGSNG
jgi:hypothetical protein